MAPKLVVDWIQYDLSGGVGQERWKPFWEDFHSDWSTPVLRHFARLENLEVKFDPSFETTTWNTWLKFASKNEFNLWQWFPKNFLQFFKFVRSCKNLRNGSIFTTHAWWCEQFYPKVLLRLVSEGTWEQVGYETRLYKQWRGLLLIYKLQIQLWHFMLILLN